ILDDDPFPTLNVTSGSVVEGDSGTTDLVFEVTLSAPSGAAVSVQFATSNITATAGLDFTFALGTLTFDPGTTNRSVTVSVSGDTTVEPNETFLLNLYNPIRALIGTVGIGTIIDDDFKMTRASMSPTGFVLDFPTLAGRRYRVEWASALTNNTV